METRRIGWMLMTAVIGLLVVPGWAEAQQTRRILITDLPIAEQVRIQVETEAREGEAAELLSQARQAEEEGDWRTAARLYEESAGLRSEGNLFGAETYELAGRAYFFGSRIGQASRMWEEAAHRSLIVGDVVGAARNYLYAAVAAQEDGKNIRASDLGWKAYRLTESRLLSDQERNLILRHIEVEGEDGA